MSSLGVVGIAGDLFKDLLYEVKELLGVDVVLEGNALVILEDFRVDITRLLIFSTLAVTDHFEMLACLFILLDLDPLRFSLFNLSIWH